MGQITLYIDSETEKKMRAAVKASGLSLSKWLANLIKIQIETEWPEHVVQLVGTWSDFPSAEEIRASLGADIKRENI